MMKMLGSKGLFSSRIHSERLHPLLEKLCQIRSYAYHSAKAVDPTALTGLRAT
jgi:hypothetical protein